MRFDWDGEKARANVIRHGVEFEAAKVVFEDLNALMELDPNDSDEERWRAIGVATGSVLFVVYVERFAWNETGNSQDEPVIRIISARRATRHEQDRYYRQAFPKR